MFICVDSLAEKLLGVPGVLNYRRESQKVHEAYEQEVDAILSSIPKDIRASEFQEIVRTSHAVAEANQRLVEKLAYLLARELQYRLSYLALKPGCKWDGSIF